MEWSTVGRLATIIMVPVWYRVIIILSSNVFKYLSTDFKTITIMVPVRYRVIIISSGDGIRHTVRATYGCRNDGNLLRYLPYQCYTVPVQGSLPV
jgi:hypothetical protein